MDVALLFVGAVKKCPGIGLRRMVAPALIFPSVPVLFLAQPPLGEFYVPAAACMDTSLSTRADSRTEKARLHLGANRACLLA